MTEDHQSALVDADEPNQKSYYAVVPATVRYDKHVRSSAKLLYGEISALCNERGYCWANNRYFAELYGVSVTSISLWISELAAAKHIDIETVKGQRRIYINQNALRKVKGQEKLKAPLREVNEPFKKTESPLKENLKHNNTCNNTINNTSNITVAPKAMPLTPFQKRWLEVWQMKRFPTALQRQAVADHENKYGYALCDEVLIWMAKDNKRNFKTFETACLNWGKRNGKEADNGKYRASTQEIKPGKYAHLSK